MKAPYSKFGQTRNVEVKVYQHGKLIESETWDEEMWVERGEDWYGLAASGNKKVRVVEREEWLRSNTAHSPNSL